MDIAPLNPFAATTAAGGGAFADPALAGLFGQMLSPLAGGVAAPAVPETGQATPTPGQPVPMAAALLAGTSALATTMPLEGQPAPNVDATGSPAAIDERPDALTEALAAAMVAAPTAALPPPPPATPLAGIGAAPAVAAPSEPQPAPLPGDPAGGVAVDAPSAPVLEPAGAAAPAGTPSAFQPMPTDAAPAQLPRSGNPMVSPAPAVPASTEAQPTDVADAAPLPSGSADMDGSAMPDLVVASAHSNAASRPERPAPAVRAANSKAADRVLVPTGPAPAPSAPAANGVAEAKAVPEAGGAEMAETAAPAKDAVPDRPAPPRQPDTGDGAEGQPVIRTASVDRSVSGPLAHEAPADLPKVQDVAAGPRDPVAKAPDTPPLFVTTEAAPAAPAERPANFAETLAALRDGRPSTQAPATEQVALQIRLGVQNGVDQLKMQLRPVELGQIDISLDIAADGAVQVQVAVERPETLELLQRDARSLERALQDAGLRADSGSMSFNLRDDGRQDRDMSRERNQRGERGERPGSPGDELHSPAAVRSLTLAPGRVDLRI